MKRSPGRTGWGWIAALLVVLCLAQGASGQFYVNVEASAGAPTPHPACATDQVTAPLSARVTNPPSGTSYCPINGPVWVWWVQNVEYRASLSDPWGPSPGGEGVMINHPDSGSGDATLISLFGQPGYWRVTTQVDVGYDNAPCGSDTWLGWAMPALTVTTIHVSFDTDPLFVYVGQAGALTATVTPADASGSVTFDTADSSIATVAGPAPSLTVTGVVAGTTQVRARLGSQVCATTTAHVVRVVLSPNPVYAPEGGQRR